MSAFVYAILGEFPSIFLALFIVDISVLGRKTSLVISYFIISVASVFIYFLHCCWLG